MNSIMHVTLITISIWYIYTWIWVFSKTSIFDDVNLRKISQMQKYPLYCCWIQTFTKRICRWIICCNISCHCYFSQAPFCMIYCFILAVTVVFAISLSHAPTHHETETRHRTLGHLHTNCDDKLVIDQWRDLSSTNLSVILFYSAADNAGKRWSDTLNGL